MKGWSVRARVALGVARILALGILMGQDPFARAGDRIDPASRGVFIENRERQFYKLVKTSEGSFGLVAVQVNSSHATPEGLTLYPSALTGGHHGVRESDPVTGRTFGPAGLQAKWFEKLRVLKVFYSNGLETRPVLLKKAPRILEDVSGVLIDLDRNLFWIQERPGQGIRIFHDHAETGRVPLNELVFGEKIMKVIPSDSGEGISVLLDSGQALGVQIRDDFALQVRRLNRLSEFRVFDLEVGPLGSNPFRYSTVLFGMSTNSEGVGIRVLEQGRLFSAPLRYVDFTNQVRDIDFVVSLRGNIHDVPLKDLLDRHPSELDRFHRVNYELRQEEIKLRIRHSNSDDPLKEKIRRKITVDPNAPGMCRLYLLSDYGLSPDLYLN